MKYDLIVYDRNNLEFSKSSATKTGEIVLEQVSGDEILKYIFMHGFINNVYDVQHRCGAHYSITIGDFKSDIIQREKDKNVSQNITPLIDFIANSAAKLM